MRLISRFKTKLLIAFHSLKANLGYKKMGDDLLMKNSTASEFRQILIDRGRPSELIAFPSNYITTAKYTLLSILPKNLFEQFHRIANIWFLIVSVLQLLPFDLSPTSN